MARKKKHPEHVNHERWLISYADFITLLFAFFTSMYAISTVDAKKAGQLVFSTRAAFNIDFFPSDKPTLGGRGGTDFSGAARTNVIGDDIETRGGKGPGKGPGKGGGGNTRGQRLEGMARKIDAVLATLASPGGVKVRREDDRLIVSLAEQLFFDGGRSTLRPKNLDTFHRIMTALADGNTDIRVEGHTDDEPLTRGPYRSNLELSVARAVSVVRYLNHEFAYPAELTSVAGYSDAHPLADNETSEGRARNRRVDIVVFAEPLPRGADANPTPAPIEPPAPSEITVSPAAREASPGTPTPPQETIAPSIAPKLAPGEH